MSEYSNIVTIVLTVNSAKLYGSSQSMMAHAVVLKNAGYNVLVILNENGPLADALSAGRFPCVVEPIFHFGLRKKWMCANILIKLTRVFASRLRFMKCVYGVLRKEGRPILHAHSIYCTYAVIAAILAGSPVVWHIREERIRNWFWTIKKVVVSMLSDRVVFVSNSIRRQYQIESGRTYTLYNWIDNPSEITRQTNSYPCRIVFIGAMCAPKGVFEFIEICRRVAVRNIAFSAFMYGEGDPESVKMIRAEIENAGIQDRCTLAGFEDDKAAIYGHADIVLLPSHTEALPRVIMEAMAYGLPVVASAVGGVPEMVLDGETGFMFSLEFLDDAVDAIEKLAKSPALRMQMGRSARERAKNLFSRDHYLRTVQLIYQALGADRPVL